MKNRISSEEPRTCPTAYDSFAFAYNLHWAPIGLNWLRWLSILIIPRLKPRARILDLCCGPGLLANELTRRGYRMVGLDGSRELLRYARANAPDVPLVQSDVRQFGMRACFDAVICVFDSLNHLLSPEDLSAAFRCVAACIRPGGWFLFDVNTEAGYLAHWHGRCTMNGEGHVVRTWSRYNRRSRMAWFKAETAEAGGSDSRKREAVLWQRCHSTVEISQALQDAGLVLVETHGLERESFVAGSLEGSERLFYLCRRPAK